MDTGSGKYVFLSYSRQDSLIADRITEALAARGVRIWRDVSDIQPGDDWMQAIDRAYTFADAIVFIASHNSFESAFITGKLRHYLRKIRDRLIPVAVDARALDNAPIELRTLQFEFLDRNFEASIDRIADALGRRGFDILPPQQVQIEAPSNKGYVFLSYAKEDLHHVGGVVDFFRSHAYAYFDYKNKERRFDADFDVELEDRLQSAALVACLISRNWKRAVWPKKEYLFASAVGVPTFLLMFEDPGPSILIIDRTPIDFTTNREAAYGILHDELQRRQL